MDGKLANMIKLLLLVFILTLSYLAQTILGGSQYFLIAPNLLPLYSLLVSALLFLAAAILFLKALAQGKNDGDFYTDRPEKNDNIKTGKSTWQKVLLILILLIAFFLRFWRLEEIPHDFHGDMASHGLMAREIISGRQKKLFETMWAEIPAIAFMPAALSMQIFGNNLFGLRMTSVLGGMLTILGTYLLVKELFQGPRGEWLALLSAALLSISYTHIHFSRIAEYIDPWPFALFSFYFLIRGLKKQRGFYFVLSGLLASFSFLMYYSGRIVIIIAFTFFLYLLFFHKKIIKRNLKGIFLYFFSFVLFLTPMILFFIKHPESFIYRSRDVFLFNRSVIVHLMDKYKVDSVLKIVLEQLKRSLLIFNHSHDSSTQFGLRRPILDDYTSPLIVLAVAYALSRFKQAGKAFFLIWLGLILILGSFLTNNAPFWPRLVGILFPAVVLIALVIDKMLVYVEQKMSKSQLMVILSALALFIIFVGFQNWTVYYRFVKDNAHNEARIGRFIKSLDPAATVCMLGPYSLKVREIAFLAYRRPTFDLSIDDDSDVFKQCPGKDKTFILFPDYLNLLAELKKRYPNGTVEEHLDSYKRLLFATFTNSQNTN